MQKLDLSDRAKYGPHRQFLVYCTFDFYLDNTKDPQHKESVSVLVTDHPESGNVFPEKDYVRANAISKARDVIQDRQEQGQYPGLDAYRVRLQNYRRQNLDTLGFYSELAEADLKIRDLRRENAVLKETIAKVKDLLQRHFGKNYLRACVLGRIIAGWIDEEYAAKIEEE